MEKKRTKKGYLQLAQRIIAVVVFVQGYDIVGTYIQCLRENINVYISFCCKV